MSVSTDAHTGLYNGSDQIGHLQCLLQRCNGVLQWLLFCAGCQVSCSLQLCNGPLPLGCLQSASAPAGTTAPSFSAFDIQSALY